MFYNKKAYELLRKCSYKKDMTEWNNQREEDNNKNINLRFADLNGFYLQGANLKNTDLRFALFDKSDLLNANVENAQIDTYSAFIWIFSIISAITFLFFYLYFQPQSQFFSAAISIAIARIVISYLLDGNIKEAASGTLLIAFVSALIGALFGALFGDARDSAIIVAVVFMIAALIMDVLDIVKRHINSNSKIISIAQNPNLAKGFNEKYITKNIETEISEKERELDRLKKEEENNERIGGLKEEIKNLKVASEQNKTIENAIADIKKPYSFLDESTQKLRRHNYFFYIVIFMVTCLAVYYVFDGYISQRSITLNTLLSKPESINFGSIIGIVIFYGSPVVFALFIVMYSVSQINRNLEKIDALSSQKHFIDILESTFKAKTAVKVSDEELGNDIKKTADALRDSTITKILDRNVKTEEPQKKERYRDRLDHKAIMPLLTALLKSK